MTASEKLTEELAQIMAETLKGPIGWRYYIPHAEKILSAISSLLIARGKVEGLQCARHIAHRLMVADPKERQAVYSAILAEEEKVLDEMSADELEAGKEGK